jgi:hypothetical protein
MEDNGKLLVFTSSMANTMHYNKSEHQLPRSNIRAVPNLHSYNNKNYLNSIIHWFKTLNKKMAEAKLGWIILAHLLSTGIWGYALFIEWGTIQGYILGGLGIVVALIQAARLGIKMAKEWYEFKGQLRDFEKPPRINKKNVKTN